MTAKHPTDDLDVMNPARSQLGFRSPGIAGLDPALWVPGTVYLALHPAAKCFVSGTAQCRRDQKY
jgi:hypothetical protein